MSNSDELPPDMVWMETDALWWRCPACGCKNLDHWIPLEVDSDVAEAYREDGEPMGESVYGYEMPEFVHCRRCRCRLEVANHYLYHEDGSDGPENDAEA